ncbi:hypothetical protein LJR175_008184 [Variovorax sp. LjRoot175]|uniref:hypothetical protein n=1 Tax=Variovorax sp. LjRoot175 TaxID=3342276 RepID=UPI003ECEC65C
MSEEDSAPRSGLQVRCLCGAGMRHQPDLAFVFRHDAAMDDGLRIGDPRKTLNNWLRANPVGRARSAQHKAAAACWKYFKDASLTRVYTAADGVMRVLGIPVDLLETE